MNSMEQGPGLGTSSRHLNDVTNTTHSLQRSQSINGVSSHTNQGATNNQGVNKRPRPAMTSSSSGGMMGVTGPNSMATKGVYNELMLLML